MNPVFAALALAVSSPQSVDFSGTVKLQNGRLGSLACVWLDGKEKSKPLKQYVIDQRDREFRPHISIVTVGTTVEFPNNDTIWHNVFADYHAQKIALGNYKRGDSRRQTFNKVGLVALLCSMHAEMSAFVMVVDTPYYAVADKSGRFTLKSVPPGDYELNVWHESNQWLKQQIQIRPGMKEVELKVSRRRT